MNSDNEAIMILGVIAVGITISALLGFLLKAWGL